MNIICLFISLKYILDGENCGSLATSPISFLMKSFLDIVPILNGHISAFTTTSVCLFSNGRALHVQGTSSDTKTDVVL